jgi:hypothetical protein
MTTYAIEAAGNTVSLRRNSLFSKLLSPAPEFSLSGKQDESRAEVENFIKQKFQHLYAADIHEFFPNLLCMKCLGMLSGTAGMRTAKSSELFLEQYLEQSIEEKISEVIQKDIYRNDIVEIGNLVSSQRGASHLLFLLFTSLLHRAGYKWIVFTATKALYNNLTKLDFELIHLAEADPLKLDKDSQDNWGKYYDTQPQVFAGNLEDAMHIIQTRPLYRRILRLYNKKITYLAKEFKAAQHD